MKSFNLAPVPPFAGQSLEQILERWLPSLYNAVRDSYPVAPKSDPIAVTVPASPASLVSSDPGFYVITGGTITTITLTRGTVTVTLPSSIVQVVVASGDTLKITYTAAPTVGFWAFYG